MDTQQAPPSMESDVHCANCGATNPASARFCGSCGSSLNPPNGSTSDPPETYNTRPLPEPDIRPLPAGELVTGNRDIDLYIIESTDETHLPCTYTARSMSTGVQVLLHEAIEPSACAGLMAWSGSGAHSPYVSDVLPAFVTLLDGTERWYMPESGLLDQARTAKNDNDWLEATRQLARGLAVLHEGGEVAFDLSPDSIAGHFSFAQGIARWHHLRDMKLVKDWPDATAHDVIALVGAMREHLINVPGIKFEIDDIVAGRKRISATVLSQLLGESKQNVDLPTQSFTRSYVEIGSATDKGMTREGNEDQFGIARRGDPARPTLLLVVADGMGGEDSGEVASALAVLTLKRSFGRLTLTGGQKLNSWIQQVSVDANEVVSKEAKRLANSMGSTLVLTLVHDGVAYLGNIGDSRIYRWNAHRDRGKMVRLTKDHSLVQRLVDLGVIKDEERYTHPERNLVLRSLGDESNHTSDLNQPVLVRPGDWFLLCSDGLWEMVRDDRIRAILSKSTSAQAAADQLITEANQNGGEDNITVVIARFG